MSESHVTLRLGAAGLDEEQEVLYRALLRIAPAKVAPLRYATGLSPQVIRRRLGELESKGLVSRLAGRDLEYLPIPPDVGLAALVQQRRQELESVQAAALEMMHEFRAGAQRRSPSELIEMIEGRDAVVQQFVQLQRSTQQEFLMFDKPPYASNISQQVDFEEALLRQGIVYRVIYDSRSLEVQPMEELERLVRAGEQARVLNDVPMKLEVSDRRVASVPLNIDEPGVEGILIIHATPLVLGLTELFERLWKAAIPLSQILAGKGRSQEGVQEPSEEDRRLLALLASGYSDAPIARRLGCNLRTVQRRVSRLMRELDAKTRYQLALQASRRGWH